MLRFSKMAFMLVILFTFITSAYSYSPPDSCLKTFNIPQDSTFSNPYDVRVDSCEGSSTYGEFYGKKYFTVNFNYNIIPRVGVFPEDTIVEYNISNIDTIYSEAISDFQALETEFGSFTFREKIPNFPDTTNLWTRSLLIYFDNYVNIDTIEKRLDSFTCVEHNGFVGWYEVLSGSPTDVETHEISKQLNYNTVTQMLTVNNQNITSNNYLQIYNLNGVEVKKVKITQMYQEINLDNLERGFYIIRYGNSIEKIIIQ